MENPVVKGWDPALDITQCAGRFVVTLPPGAEHGFAGARRLQADLAYAAQAAADGSGFVYQATDRRKASRIRSNRLLKKGLAIAP
jgi:dienelactone hydrolase